MIIDAVLYNGEADLLRLRLDTLDRVIDRCIVVEGLETFSGQRKPATLLREPALASYLDQIVYVVAPLLSDAPSAWHREAWQRNQIVRGLAGVPDSATVLVGDVDEIPHGEALVAVWAHAGGHGIIRTCAQSHRAYDARNVRQGAWRGTCVATAQTVRQLSPEGVRRRRIEAEVIMPGGWHFTHMGSAERLAEKVRAFSHQEFHTPNVLAQLAARRARGVDPFGRPDEIYAWQPDAPLPAPLAAHPAHYPMLWRDAP